MISLSALVGVVVGLIIVGLVFWLLKWLVDYCQLGEPFRKIADIVLAVVAVLAIISLLLPLAGGPSLFRWGP